MLVGVPAFGMIYEHFPVFKRFTYVSNVYAIAQAVVYVITSFGLVYLTDFFGHGGSWVLLGPTTLAFIWASMHFESLRNTGQKNFFNKRSFNKDAIVRSELASSNVD